MSVIGLCLQFSAAKVVDHLALALCAVLRELDVLVRLGLGLGLELGADLEHVAPTLAPKAPALDLAAQTVPRLAVVPPVALDPFAVSRLALELH